MPITPQFLIADDNLANRTLLDHLLRQYGSCTFATNGLEAVKRYQHSWEEEQPFSVIFMDVMMPEMNGTDALRMIREFEATQGIPMVNVIMVSALRDGDNIQQSRSAGAQHYLIKPFREKEIFSLLSSFGLHPLENG